MRKRSTKVFELIPSVQTRKQSPGPIAFIPALPIKLETVGSGAGHYAVVDTAAKISSISSALVPGDLLLGTDDTIRATSSQDPIRIVKFSIILCDTSFSPWAHLSDVPFAIFPGREPSTQSSLVLGFFLEGNRQLKAVLYLGLTPVSPGSFLTSTFHSANSK
jgi:hypothetical protein